MNASTWTVTTTYEVPGSGGAGTSSFVTVDPATGDLWISDNGVLVVDPSDWTTQAVFAGQHTGEVAIDGSDAWLPVGSSLLEVSTSDFTTVRSIATGGPLSTVSAALDGSRIYVTYAVPSMGNFEYYLVAVDATTGASAYTVLVGASDEDGPVIATVSPDGSTIFIATGFIDFGGPAPVTGYLRTIDTATGTLTGDGVQTNQPVTSLVLDPNPPIPTQGYWQVAADGGVFSFGNAAFYGSMGGHPLNQPIVGIAAGPDDQGYWEVASDGGIFAFGDAGLLRLDGRSPAEPAHRGYRRDPGSARATGRWPATAASSPSATRSSTARWAVTRSTSPSWVSPPPRTAMGTGRWPVTAASSPSATPPSTARWGGIC